MTMPNQKREESKQDYQTPPEFLCAVERDFAVNTWAVDLAATADNRVAVYWCGPGSEEPDSLAYDWNLLSGNFSGNFWLNPPFKDITPWAKKCSEYKGGGRIFLLVPASVGANWFRDHVHGKAHVIALSPRLTFVGCDGPYPKDLMLAVFGPVRGGFSTWRWKP
jgi:hypothetical protein